MASIQYIVVSYEIIWVMRKRMFIIDDTVDLIFRDFYSNFFKEIKTVFF